MALHRLVLLATFAAPFAQASVNPGGEGDAERRSVEGAASTLTMDERLVTSAPVAPATAIRRAVNPGSRAHDRRLHGRRAFVADGTTHEFRGVFDTVDSRRFRSAEQSPATRRLNASRMPFAFAGVGFPHIETLAQVRCMGLSSRAVAKRAARYVPTIDRLANEHGLAPSLVMAVVAQESCFDPRAVSTAGALGLMQLMPATARWLKAGDVRHADANLRAGVRYLAHMHATFGSVELALAAYNAGPGNVRRYGGIPPFHETRTYVTRVLSYQRRYAVAAQYASL